MNDQLTEKIIGAAFEVHTRLGFGFLESVYEKALSIELDKLGIAHQRQVAINVYYEEQLVGEFRCDLFIAGSLIVELKSVAQIAAVHEVQLVNYLTATKTDIGLLLNFGPTRVDVKRKYRNCKRGNRQDEHE